MTTHWAKHPIIYQINTLVWLNTLSQRYQRPISLANIPPEEIDALALTHSNCIWLMGIWHRGAFCRSSALNYIHEYRTALPDVKSADVVGSAYAIGGYKVDRAIGGKKGLEMFRRQIASRGMKLLLDFVPNHVGRDHPWISEHPEYFVRGNRDILARDGGNFYATTDAHGAEIVVAHGRDPHYAGWIDTAQLNIFDESLRQAVIATLTEIATMCDGVRCDMAMLMTDRIFTRTWGWLGLKPLAQPYWEQVIGAVRAQSPDFLFAAEVYWNMEFELIQAGFDYTYDKTFYDRAVERDYEDLYGHLTADPAFLRHNIRFIENHDEPRAATTFGIDRSRPLAALICTLPGATLLHDGQLLGRRVKLPVQITRQPKETEHRSLYRFYEALLKEASQPIYGEGEWVLLQRQPTPEGEGHIHIIAHGWRIGDDLRVVVVNLSDNWSQALIDLSPWAHTLAHKSVNARDVLTRSVTLFDGDSLLADGLLMDMSAYQVVIYQFSLTRKRHKTSPLQLA